MNFPGRGQALNQKVYPEVLRSLSITDLPHPELGRYENPSAVLHEPLQLPRTPRRLLVVPEPRRQPRVPLFVQHPRDAARPDAFLSRHVPARERGSAADF